MALNTLILVTTINKVDLTQKEPVHSIYNSNKINIIQVSAELIFFFLSRCNMEQQIFSEHKNVYVNAGDLTFRTEEDTKTIQIYL